MNIYDLIALYLEDKQHLTTENDSYNVVKGSIYSWNFTNIPCPTAEELVVCKIAVEAKQSKQAKLAQIAELEAQVTPRRIREAVISGDNSFIANIDAQIAAIRATIG